MSRYFGEGVSDDTYGPEYRPDLLNPTGPELGPVYQPALLFFDQYRWWLIGGSIALAGLALAGGGVAVARRARRRR